MLKRITYTLILFFGFFAVFPSSTYAKSYSIVSDEFVFRLASDRSVEVREELTYFFDGSFTWADMWIPLTVESAGVQKAVTIENFSITASDGSPVTVDYGLQSDDRFEVKWSYSAMNEQKTFIITYTIQNAVTKHQDIAEFYWKVIGEDWDIGHNNVNVKVVLPQSVHSADEVLVYGHGPLNGQSSRDTQVAAFSAEYVGVGEFMEVRTLFPSRLVDGAPDGSLTKDEIVAEEARYVEETIASIARQQRIQKLLIALILFWFPTSLLIWAMLWYRTWNTKGREYQVLNVPEYLREPVSDLQPALVYTLIHQGEKAPIQAFTATLFDLAQRDFIQVEDEVEMKVGLLRRKREYTTTLTLQPNKLAEQAHTLTKWERDLMQLLFETIAKAPPSVISTIFKTKDTTYDKTDLSVTFDEITTWLKEHQREFREWFTQWQEDIEKESKDKAFVEEKSASALHWVWLITVLMALTNPLIIVPAAIANHHVKRWSKEWVEEASRWKAFANFLHDFSSFKELPPESYKLWERYLVFGVLFGYADTIIKMLPVILQNPDAAPATWYVMHGGVQSNIGMADSIANFSQSMQSFNSNLTSAAHYSSGSGGGFSGGGGSGGGGGGGGAG